MAVDLIEKFVCHMNIDCPEVCEMRYCYTDRLSKKMTTCHHVHSDDEQCLGFTKDDLRHSSLCVKYVVADRDDSALSGTIVT